MNLVLLLGGQKSGKSSTAARLARESGRPVVVIAPARADDEEFRRRIARHQADRPRHWTTIETFDLVGALEQAGPDSYVVVDALDTWLLETANQLDLLDADVPVAEPPVETSLMTAVDAFVQAALERPGSVTVIAGQPGLGPIGADRVTRRYVDLHGLAVQRIAARADRVDVIIAGRRLPLGAAELQPLPWPAPHDRSPTGEPDTVAALIAAVVPADAEARETARVRHDQLAKPPGSMGRLETIGLQLAAIARTCPPPIPRRPCLVVVAGDHGVHTHGVSAWPQHVSATITQAILDGHATASVLARQAGIDLVVLDVGLASDLRDHPRLRVSKIRRGTRDLTRTDAMTADETLDAVRAGARATGDLIRNGTDLLVVGEVGIANTTPTAALIAALTDSLPSEVTGRGASPDDSTRARKTAAIAAGLARHGADRDPMRVLAALGGLEQAALAGTLIAAAGAGIPVVLDGVTTVAAALVAARLAPAATDYLIAGHRTTEPANLPALAQLGLRPLLDLDLRLGEGTGGLLAVPLVQAAAALLDEVAALADLGTEPGRAEPSPGPPARR